MQAVQPTSIQKFTEQDAQQAQAGSGASVLLLGVGSLGCYLVAKTQQAELPVPVRYALMHHKAALLQNRADTLCFHLNETSGPLQQRLTEEDYLAVQQAIAHADVVVLCAALGGASGALLAELAELKAQDTLAFVITPFSFEGGARLKQAKATLQQLENQCSSILELPNDLLRQALGGHTALHQALDASNVFLHQALQQLLGLMIEPGLIHLDIIHFKTMLSHRGRMLIGWHQLDPNQPLSPQVASLLQQPLLAQANVKTAKAAMLYVQAPDNLATDTYCQLHTELQRLLPNIDLMLTGVQLHTDSNLQITLCLTGIQRTLTEQP